MMAASSYETSVKEFSGHGEGGATTLNVPLVERAIKEEIPTIDFSILIKGSPKERSRIFEEIGRACKEWGCFTVFNHNVPEKLMSMMLEAISAFFDLTEEEKYEYLNVEPFDPIKYVGFKDGYQGREALRLYVNQPIQLPSKLANFSEIFEQYARHTKSMSAELLRALWESLGASESNIEEILQMKRGLQVLVNNIYHPCSQQEAPIGFPAHTDNSFLTIIMQDKSIASLQVLHHGIWVPVEPTPNSFFVQVGDYLEIVSNGLFKSVLHRVIVNNKNKRISVVSITGTPFETVIAPLPQLVDISNTPAAYQSITMKDSILLKQKDLLNKAFLDRIRL